MDRKKASRSFFGELSLTTKKMKIYPIEGNQNAEQITLMMDRLVRCLVFLGQWWKEYCFER